MKFKQIIPIIILIFLYIIAIKDTITLYYIPGAEFSSFVSHIYPPLIIYIVLIEAFFSVPFLLMMTISVRQCYRQSPPLKLPFFMVVEVIGILAVLIIINNYVSGIFWYSATLLLIGTFFTLFYFRLRQIGQGAAHFPVKKTPVKNPHYLMEFEGLCAYIMELELFRPPVPGGITPYSFNSLGLISKQMQKHAFKKTNQALYNDIYKDLDPFFQKAIYSYPFNAAPGEFFLRYSLRFHLNMHRMARRRNGPHFTRYEDNSMDALYPLSNYLMISTFVILFSIKFLGLIDVLNIFSMVLLPIIAYIGIYICFFFACTRQRRIWGEKYENTLKRSVQRLIDEGIALSAKKKINTADYPLKLRHNDYSGLIYQKKGKNNYLAYFINDE